MDESLDRYLQATGFVSSVREDVEVFHESTKLARATEELVARRIMEYLSSERGRLEISRNRRSYPLARRLRLPAANPSAISLSDCLDARRSVRTFAERPLSLARLANVLAGARVRQRGVWEAEVGVDIGLRAYPSGGGLYPIETYVALLRVEGIAPGVAHYDPYAHELQVFEPSLQPDALARALGGAAPWVPVVLFACALFERSVVKYGRRGYRFAMLEAGMLTYLYALVATASGLGSLHWGGFLDDEVHDLLGLDGIGETIVDCVLIGDRAP
jgi:SagB-type dehydrogenase family enzyme